MEYRNTTISVKALKSIIGDTLYKRLAAGILKYCPPLLDGEEPSVFVDSIPLSGISKEARAAIFNMAEKKVQPAICGLSKKPQLGRRKVRQGPVPVGLMRAICEIRQSLSLLERQVLENKCPASHIPHQGGTNACFSCIQNQEEAIRRQSFARIHCRCCRRSCPLCNEGLL